MKAFIGVTDKDWFDLLRNTAGIDEVNFWQPSGNSVFKALLPGELFLFKLHRPLDFIVGGGIFAYANLSPIVLAWESFGIANGARNLSEMRQRVEKYRQQSKTLPPDYTIGCILLQQPFFLPREAWIPIPENWSFNIVRGKTYDLTVEPGLSILKNLHFGSAVTNVVREEAAQYGKEIKILPRLGQGSFRMMVTDAYERRCAITSERTLPALDAAHIIPFSEQGENITSNGILLRRDLHALFDHGYITINPSLVVEVSHKIKEEFENGRDYYRLHGGNIRLPVNLKDRPSKEYLEWHNEHIYLG
jgi:putative restriction endonuclease